MRESVVEREGTARFEARGWLARKVGYIGRRGAPDRWYLKAGIWAIVEYKAPGEDLSSLQAKEVPRLRAAGARVFVIDTIADAYALVDQLEAEIAARA